MTFRIIETKDGSKGLYNIELEEVYHSFLGAQTEAIQKFVNPVKKLDYKPLSILDICYGVGYNTKTALLELKNIESIDCVEIDKKLVEFSFNFEFNDKINKTIEKNYKNPDFITFYIDDIRKVVKKLDKKYDIIFYDGFAPYKDSCLWSEELIFEVSKLLKKQGLITTYNHSKPVLNAFFKAKMNIGKTIYDKKTIGSVFSFDKKLLDNPLSDFELETLETKSAITYKDKNLNSTHKKIVELRNKEVEQSKKPTLSSYKKKNIEKK